MKIRYSTNPNDAKYYTTEELREHYLVDELFENDTIKETKMEGLSIIGIMPKKKEVILEVNNKSVLVLTVATSGIVTIGEKSFTLDSYQGLLVSNKEEKITFKNIEDGIIARFLVIKSNCCNQETKQIDLKETYKNDYFELGLKTINNSYFDAYISNAPQLYLYSELDSVACHIMGEEMETRHLFVKENDLIISPSWSIFATYGPSEYKIIYYKINEDVTNIDIDQLK